MTRTRPWHIYPHVVAVALTLFVAVGGRLCGAQNLPPPDSRSGTLSIASRGIWRSMSLSDGLSVHGVLALPVFGAPGLRRGLQLEGRLWDALENRDRFRVADQYGVTARYLHRLEPSSRDQYFSLAYTEFATPNARAFNPIAPRAGGEVEAGVVLETSNPSLGIPAIRFYGEVAHELQRSKATFATVGAAHTIGTGSITATLGLSVSASNYGPDPRVDHSSNQDFQFHSAEGTFGVAYTWPLDRLSSWATKTALNGHASLRADRLGQKVGWMELSQFVQMF